MSCPSNAETLSQRCQKSVQLTLRLAPSVLRHLPAPPSFVATFRWVQASCKSCIDTGKIYPHETGYVTVSTDSPAPFEGGQAKTRNADFMRDRRAKKAAPRQSLHPAVRFGHLSAWL